MPASGPNPHPSTATERQKLIAEYEETKRSESERHTSDQAAAVRRRRVQRATILGLLLVVTGFLAFNPPAWLLPPAVPALSPAEAAAGNRFAIYLQAQQIEHFRSVRGRLPGSLEEAGEPLPGVQYSVLGGGNYALQSSRDSSIRYVSTDSLGTFLGSSMSLLGTSNE